MQCQFITLTAIMRCYVHRKQQNSYRFYCYYSSTL